MTVKLKRRKFIKRLIKRTFLLIAFLVVGFILFNYDVFYRVINRGESYQYSQTNCHSNENHSITSENIEFKSLINKAKDSVLALKKTYNIPGLTVCVSVKDKVIWSQGFGCIDIKNNVPVTTSSLFRVGSISKCMTAIGLLKLVQDNKVDLNKNVSDYYPEFPKKEYSIPIKYLASHQSGIRHYNGFEMLSNDSYNNIQESLNTFINDPLLFEPGTDYKYSTYNYTLLSRLIEKITSISYLDFMDKQVFKPLGMESTYAEKKSDNFTGYSSGINSSIKKAIEVNVSNKYAGGGYLSTSNDLVIMMQNLNSLLTKESQSKLFEIQNLKNGKETGAEYALGFRKTYLKKTNRTLIHHGGSSIGARAFLLKIEEEDIIIAICANSDSGVLRPQNFDLQEVYNIAKVFIEK